MTYNVLFPTGRVMCFFVKDLALIYCNAYGGTLLPADAPLPNKPVDKPSVARYNGFVMNKEVIK